ncbi:MAG: clostripain-related cysteine peptidase [Chloroflexota bacterium]
MTYEGTTIEAKTAWYDEFTDDGPIFMFNIEPWRTLRATSGSTVTMEVNHEGADCNKSKFHESKTVLLDGGNDVGDVYVSFGESNIPPTTTPTPPNEPQSDFVDIHNNGGVSAGAFHTCAVVNGTLWCWGQDSYNQLGPNGQSSVSTPNPVTLGARVIKVDAGKYHTCALMEAGEVWCWGGNRYGALGHVTDEFLSDVPARVTGIENAVDIVVGDRASCAILEDRTAKCWGYNGNGRLGRNNDLIGPAFIKDESDLIAPDFVRDATDGQPLQDITKIDTHSNHMCAVADSSLYCWGNVYLHQAATDSNVPVEFAAAVKVSEYSGISELATGIVDIATGLSHTCVIKSSAETDGSIWCFGWSEKFYSNGEFNAAVPKKMFEINNAKKITAGYHNTCARLHDGRILCWGGGWASNEPAVQMYGELGQNGFFPSATPIEITGLPEDSIITSISAGDRHICAQGHTGDVFCWGDNYYGQLGRGSSNVRPDPAPKNMSNVAEPMRQIAPGAYHSCVLVGTGQVQCVGANSYGQVGSGPATFYVDVPQIVALGETVKMVTSGDFHSCALTETDRVLCWGANQRYHQLGSATPVSSTVPIPVAGLYNKPIRSISAGSWHTCVLYEDGTGQCWGDNRWGQLGNGATGKSATPVDIVGLSGPITKLVAGWRHTCAINIMGAAQCWGQNGDGSVDSGFYGILGTNSTIVSSTRPITPTNLISGVTDIDIGGSATCALKEAKVYCWGNIGFMDDENNEYGRLDENNNSNLARIPTPVHSWTAGDINQIAVSTHSACALHAGGYSTCVGSNQSDQIGVDLSPNEKTLVPVTTTGLISNVVEITAGPFSYSYCARLNDDSGQCWGYDPIGKHGNGVVAINPTPAKVVGLAPAKWTYILYLAGDNDLSSYLDSISRNLNRLPDSEHINIAILFDGIEEGDSYVWVTRPGGEYKVGLHKWRLREESANTGDGNTLVNFVEWAQTHFPAEHYYLSIANHGRALAGTAWKTNSNSPYKNGEGWDRLEQSELKQALSTITHKGKQQLDIIHFDSCLMALFETAYQIKDYARYMIASQNLTYSFYPYFDYAMRVIDDPQIAPRDLAVVIANDYFNQEYLKVNEQPRTISVFDLSRVDVTKTAIDNLAIALRSEVPSKSQTIKNVQEATQRSDSSDYFEITPEDEYLDLYDLVNRIAITTELSSVWDEAEEVRRHISPNTTNSLIITNHVHSGTDVLVSGNHWNLDNNHGVNIYFPKDQNSFDYANYIESKIFTFTQESEWDGFLSEYIEKLNVSDIPLDDPGMPPVLRPSRLITNHCGDHEDGCLWGVVKLMGIAEPNVEMTIQTPSRTYITRTQIRKNSEVDPIFAMPLHPNELAIGDEITFTAVYTGPISEYRDKPFSQTLRFIPSSSTNEQEFVITLDRDENGRPPLPTHPNVQVSIQNAAVWTETEAPDSTTQITTTFHAVAQSSDGSDVNYLWHSDKDGTLGSGGTFRLPASTLSPGIHQITVQAVNIDGIRSESFTMALEIDSPTPTPTSTPLPTPSATSTPSPTPMPTSTPSPTHTPTFTLAPSPMPTNIPSPTSTPTFTLSPSPVPTNTLSPPATQTSTPLPPPTPTPTSTDKAMPNPTVATTPSGGNTEIRQHRIYLPVSVQN